MRSALAHTWLYETMSAKLRSPRFAQFGTPRWYPAYRRSPAGRRAHEPTHRDLPPNPTAGPVGSYEGSASRSSARVSALLP